MRRAARLRKPVYILYWVSFFHFFCFFNIFYCSVWFFSPIFSSQVYFFYVCCLFGLVFVLFVSSFSLFVIFFCFVLSPRFRVRFPGCLKTLGVLAVAIKDRTSSGHFAVADPRPTLQLLADALSKHPRLVQSLASCLFFFFFVKKKSSFLACYFGFLFFFLVFLRNCDLAFLWADILWACELMSLFSVLMMFYLVCLVRARARNAYTHPYSRKTHQESTVFRFLTADRPHVKSTDVPMYLVLPSFSSARLVENSLGLPTMGI